MPEATMQILATQLVLAEPVWSKLACGHCSYMHLKLAAAEYTLFRLQQPVLKLLSSY